MPENFPAKERFFMTKSEARDILFTLVYESEFSPEKSAADIYESAREERGFENYRYIKKGLEYIIAEKAYFEKMIDSLADGWNVDRIAPVTKAILTVALYDIKVKSLAPNIAINEAVELAKKYDADTAPSFVNGILNSAVTADLPDAADAETPAEAQPAADSADE